MVTAAPFITVQTWQQLTYLSVSEQVNSGPWDNGILFRTKNGELWPHEKTGKLSCLFANERSQLEKPINRNIPITQHPQKDKIVKTVRQSTGCQGSVMGKRVNRQRRQGFSDSEISVVVTRSAVNLSELHRAHHLVWSLVWTADLQVILWQCRATDSLTCVTVGQGVSGLFFPKKNSKAVNHRCWVSFVEQQSDWGAHHQCVLQEQKCHQHNRAKETVSQRWDTGREWGRPQQPCDRLQLNNRGVFSSYLASETL